MHTSRAQKVCRRDVTRLWLVERLTNRHVTEIVVAIK